MPELLSDQGGYVTLNSYNSWLNFMENNSAEEISIIKYCSFGSVRFGQSGVPPVICCTNNVVNNNLLRLPPANFKQLVLPMNKITLYLHSYHRSLQIHLCTGICKIHLYSCSQSWQLYYMGRPAHIRRYLTWENMIRILYLSTGGMNIFSRPICSSRDKGVLNKHSI